MPMSMDPSLSLIPVHMPISLAQSTLHVPLCGNRRIRSPVIRSHRGHTPVGSPRVGKCTHSRVKTEMHARKHKAKRKVRKLSYGSIRTDSAACPRRCPPVTPDSRHSLQAPPPRPRHQPTAPTAVQSAPISRPPPRSRSRRHRSRRHRSRRPTRLGANSPSTR